MSQGHNYLHSYLPISFFFFLVVFSFCVRIIIYRRVYLTRLLIKGNEMHGSSTDLVDDLDFNSFLFVLDSSRQSVFIY
jgi:hypothetical protein